MSYDEQSKMISNYASSTTNTIYNLQKKWQFKNYSKLDYKLLTTVKKMKNDPKILEKLKPVERSELMDPRGISIYKFSK